MSLTLPQVVLLDLALAFASHHLWFRKYEPRSPKAILAVTTGLTSPIVHLLVPHTPSVIHAFLLANIIHISGLFLSVALYRLGPFHPLAAIPGPILCKLSKIWIASVAWRGDLHRYIKSVHDEYGLVTRIGPNEISVVDKKLLPAILGANGMPKGPVWDARRKITSRDTKNHNNLHAVRDLKLHAELRKPWNKAFAKEAMKDYEELLLARSLELVQHLQAKCSERPVSDGKEGSKGVVVDLARWLSLFSFDFMGDMAFGGTYNLMKDQDSGNSWDIMEKSLLFPSVAQHVPWVAPFTHLFPSVTKASVEFTKFAAAQAKKRAASEPQQRDLFYHLINHTEAEPGTSPLPLIMSSSVLAIVAGSDTIATALSNTFYFLLAHPEWLERVRNEVDSLCEDLQLPEKEVPRPEKLAQLEVLGAVLNETLRMLPPLPSQLQRAPAEGSGGQLLGLIFLPEGTAVQIPPYSIHRNPAYFSPSPDHFRPERWLPQPSPFSSSDFTSSNSRLDKSAFIPFSLGPANCVGRHLAMDELRYIVSLLIRNFYIQFEEGYDQGRWEKELEDRFLVVKGALPVRVRVRKESRDTQ
ncbi:cytochrome P450 67 [Coprinopsis cinerea okayama7|uniref:Cytochrome P450 67 n=1 Tax=Coprinopsis cinerea (strain Okayama-7 / 130 / ATCC MYA-4618 / FGSC 9003) TaxID=240176 RepID=A8NJ56_COPC7|nr:cytochrome P450 67 [Coprinopsis cinerea okayama7\|eukprot:XP_001834150.2 cytochrome P450 67 [Coprinopsis cinerea okayama7\